MRDLRVQSIGGDRRGREISSGEGGKEIVLEEKLYLIIISLGHKASLRKN